MTARRWLLCVVIVAANFVSSNSIRSDDPEPKPLRWDDSFFGITLGKPEKGKRWVVVDTVPYSSGAILEEGDEIISINKKRVSRDDDVLQLLNDAGDEVQIRASRKIGRKTVTDSATFTRTTRWEATKGAFDIHDDPINELQIWKVKGISESLQDTTHLLPDIVFRNGHPQLLVLRFQYRAEDWLFISKLTIKYGDKTFEFERDLLTEAKREVLNGGIKEWFSLADAEAAELVTHIGTNPLDECIIRLHGKDYYKDVELSPVERAAFMWTTRLWTFGKQRETELAGTKP
jgi:hypothetical protein